MTVSNHKLTLAALTLSCAIFVNSLAARAEGEVSATPAIAVPTRAYAITVVPKEALHDLSWINGLSEAERYRTGVRPDFVAPNEYGGLEEDESVRRLPYVMGDYYHQRAAFLVTGERDREVLREAIVRRWRQRGLAAVPPYVSEGQGDRERLFHGDGASQTAPSVCVLPLELDLGVEGPCNSPAELERDLCGLQPHGCGGRPGEQVRVAVAAFGLEHLRDASERQQRIDALAGWSEKNPSAVVYVLFGAEGLTWRPPDDWTVAIVQAPAWEAVDEVLEDAAGDAPRLHPRGDLIRSLRRNGALREAFRHALVRELLLQDEEAGREPPRRLTELGERFHEEVLAQVNPVLGGDGEALARFESGLFSLAAAAYQLDGCSSNREARWTFSVAEFLATLGEPWTPAELARLPGILFERTSTGPGLVDDEFRFTLQFYREYLAARFYAARSNRKKTTSAVVRRAQDPSWRELLPLYCGQLSQAEEQEAVVKEFDRIQNGKLREVREDIFGGVNLAYGRCVSELDTEVVSLDAVKAAFRDVAAGRAPTAGWDLYREHPGVRGEWRDVVRRLLVFREQYPEFDHEILHPVVGGLTGKTQAATLAAIVDLVPSSTEVATWNELWDSSTKDARLTEDGRSLFAALEILPSRLRMQRPAREMVEDFLKVAERPDAEDSEKWAALSLAVALCRRDVSGCSGELQTAVYVLASMQRASPEDFTEALHKAIVRHLRQRRVFRRDFVKESFPPPSWGKWCKENWDGSSGICREWGVALAFPPLSEALVETDELPDAFVMDILGEKAAASARDPLENEIVAGAATASCIAVANGARSPLHWNTLRRGLLHLDSGTQERVYRELQRSPCDSRALLEVHRANAGVTFGGDGGSPSAQSVTSAGATSPVKLQALRRYLIATTKDSHEAAIDPSSLLRRLPRKQRPGFVYEMCLHQSMWNDRFESDLWAELMNRDRDPDPDLRLACARALWQRYRGPSAKARPEFGKNRKRLLAAVLSWYAEPLVDVQQRARIAERAIRVVDWEHSPTGQTLDFLEKILELLRESTGPSSAQVDDAQQMLRRAFMPLWQEGRSHAFYVERTGKEAPSVFSAACLAGRWQPRSRDSAETLERMQSRLRENRPLEAIDLYERVPLWMSRIDEKNGTVDPIAKHSSCLYASALVDVGEAKKALVILGRYDDLEIDLSDKDLASVCLFARGHAYRVDGRPDLAIDDFRSAEGMGEDYRFWSEVQHAWARAELLSSCLKNPDSEKLKCSYISDGYEFQKETIAMFERHEENRRSLWEERGCGEGSRVQSPSSECDSIKIDADVLDGWAYSYDNGTEQGASDAIEFIDREIGRFDGDLGYSVVEARLENRKGYFCHELLGQTYKAHIAFQKAKDIVVKWGADDRERFPVVEGVVLNYMESALLYKEFDEVVALSRLLERRSDRETANGAMNVIFRFLALAGQRAQGKPVDVEVLADACLSAWHAYEGFPADSGWKFNGSRKYIARRSASLAGRDKGLDKYFGALDGVFLALEKPGSWEGKRALGAEFRTWTVGRDPVFFLEHEWKWARRSSDGDALEAEVDEALGSSPVLSWESPERFVPVLLRRGGNSGFGSVVGIEMTCSARWDEEEEVVPVELAWDAEHVVMSWSRPQASRDHDTRYVCEGNLLIFGHEWPGQELVLEFSVAGAPFGVRAKEWLGDYWSLPLSFVGVVLFVLSWRRRGRIQLARSRREFLDARHNPYQDRARRAVERRSELFGRVDELDELESILSDAEYPAWTLLTGPSRIGKTSLLHVLRNDVIPGLDVEGYEFVPVLLRVGMLRPERILFFIVRSIRNALLGRGFEVCEALSLDLDETAPEDYGAIGFHEDIEELTSVASESIGKTVRVVLLLDEGDILVQMEGHLQHTIREASDGTQGSVPVISTLLVDPRLDIDASPGIAQSPRVNVGPLSLGAIRELLCDPVRHRNGLLLDFEEEVFEEVHRQARDGFPYFVLLFGELLLKRCREAEPRRYRVTCEDVQAVAPKVYRYWLREDAEIHGRGKVSALLEAADKVYKTMLDEERTHTTFEEREALNALAGRLEEQDATGSDLGTGHGPELHRDGDGASGSDGEAAGGGEE